MATAQTGLGRVEIGMTDGAAYALAVTGPVVDEATTIDNANATFFRDPSTGRAFIDVFTLNSAVESSLNYAKLSYYTPRLFGMQLAASYTPSEGKDVLPSSPAGRMWRTGRRASGKERPATATISGPSRSAFTAALRSRMPTASKTPGSRGPDGMGPGQRARLQSSTTT